MAIWDKALRAIPRVSITLGQQNNTRPWGMNHPGPDHPGWVWPDQDDFQRAIDRAFLSSLIAAVTGYRARNAASTPWVLRRRDKTETLTAHPVIDLLNAFNSKEDGRSAVMSLWRSLDVRGETYMLKASNGAGRVAELWRRPRRMLRPRTDSRGFLSHYEYRVQYAAPVNYAPEEVIHLRYPDPEGLPWEAECPLSAVGMELYLDNEAGQHSAAMLKNGARPGVIFALGDMSPEDRPNEQELEAMRAYLMREYTGSGRGKPMMMEFPVSLLKPQYSPEEMQITGLHDYAEERICGLFGLPAALVQMRTGIARTTANATLREWERQAWHASIIPVQDMIAEQLTRQLLPDFMGETEAKAWVLDYDRSGVVVLQADELREAQKWNINVRAATATIGESRAAQGLEVFPEQEDLYLVPSGFELLSLEDIMAEPEPMPMPPQLQAPNPLPEGEGEDDEEEDATRAIRQGLPRMSRQARALVRRLDKDERRQEKRFTRELEEAFRDLAGMAATEFIRQDNAAVREITPDDAALAMRVFGALDIDAWEQAALLPAFDGHYLRTLTATVQGINVSLGLQVNLPDPVQRQILAEGGKRMGLLDIPTGTRDSIFRALEAGREAGEGVEELARRIRHDVGSGRFTKAGPNYRARMIARTETKHAQGQSMLASYREAGVVQVRLIDDQLGYGDEECSARNGTITNLEGFEEALAMEHPNHTLRCIPLVTE